MTLRRRLAIGFLLALILAMTLVWITRREWSHSAGAVSAPCVTGHVTSADVGPEHAWIGTAQVLSAADEGRIQLANVEIERSGAFAVSGLPTRPLRLQVISAGFEPVEREFTPGTPATPTTVDVALKTLPRLELRLESSPGVAWRDATDPRVVELTSRLRPFLTRRCPSVGDVLPSDMPRIAARRVPPRSPGRAAWWDFELDGWQEGFCCVVLGSRVLDVQRFALEQRVVTMIVPDSALTASVGSLHVRVVDEARAPIAGAHVWARSEDATTVDRTTDANGACALEGISPGSIQVSLITPGRPRVEMSRELLPGAVLDLGELAVEAGITLRGRVEVPRELVGCSSVTIRNLDASRDNLDWSSTSSPNDGAFSIAPLARGEYALAVRHEFFPEDAQDVRAGRAPGWSYVDLRHGPVDPVVVRPSPEALERMRELIREIGPPPRKP